MQTHTLEVWGEYACFTRPEMKVERMSYDVITPSAARAIFESIVWKPGLHWQLTEIQVLKPIRWASVRRNEVGAILSTRNVEIAMRTGRGNLHLAVEEERQQRATLLLREVHYRLTARLELVPELLAAEGAAKYHEMFRRRAEKGQCINQPYLGCREFACGFRLLDEVPSKPEPIAETRDLGWMLYDIDFRAPGGLQPMFYRPALNQGVITVPPLDSPEVRR